MVFREVVVTDVFVLRDILGIPVKTLKVTHVPNEFHQARILLDPLLVSLHRKCECVLKYSEDIHVWLKTVCTVTELIKITFLHSTLILANLNIVLIFVLFCISCYYFHGYE